MPIDGLEHADPSDRERWGPLTCALLGVWLLGSPAGLGYQDMSMAWNDYAVGTASLALGVIAARRSEHGIKSWLLCFLGIWQLHAPLIMWAPSAVAYLNGTVVGIGLIAFSVVLPRRQWCRLSVEPEVPPGWTFNPSSWAQRTPIIALAWINFLIARYLAAYQLGHIPSPWDPFFGDGTQRVLDSEVSEAFPVSDAGLGAAAYIIEALVGYMGTSSRWRTAPWTVALFGVLVIPVGVVSTILMILQPIAVGAWCTICLITAGLMLVMACLALPEVAAMLHYLQRSRRVGRSVWRTFWFGGGDDGGFTKAAPVRFSSPLPIFFHAMVCGTTIPWSLGLSTAVGLWFIASSSILGFENRAMDAHVIAGALVIVISILAMSEVLRIARFANIVVGALLAALVWLLDGAPPAGAITTTLFGLLLIVLSLPRGSIRQRYGTWEQLIR